MVVFAHFGGTLLERDFMQKPIAANGVEYIVAQDLDIAGLNVTAMNRSAVDRIHD